MIQSENKISYTRPPPKKKIEHSQNVTKEYYS